MDKYEDCVPIQCMAKNCEGVIVKLDGEKLAVHRLEEMGICSGCHIKIICAGEPCLLKINDRKICLRTENLNNIYVCPFIEDTP